MTDFYIHCESYIQKLGRALGCIDRTRVRTLAEDLARCREDGSRVYLAGNGGSASSCEHLANDLVRCGIRAFALTANTALLTCIANDDGYDQVFAYQLRCFADERDILIAMSGSGDSRNVLQAIEAAGVMGLRSYAIVGSNGGRAKQMADVTIHALDADMQQSEDGMLTIGHLLMQWLRR